MTSGVRFGAAQARLRALKSRLWTPLDRPLVVQAGLQPDGRPISDDPDETWGGVTSWYRTLIGIYPSAASLFAALFRRHEIENVKLLWRAAMRARPPDPSCWRPLGSLARVTAPARQETVPDLVGRLEETPYAPIAQTLARTESPAIAEIGLDRWVWTAVWDRACALPRRETTARALVRLLILEHDLDLLRRGPSLGLAPDMVRKATVVLGKERRTPEVGIPPDGDAAAWDRERLGLRRTRRQACRRAFVGWPFQLGPAVAALLLREEQAAATLSIAAARRGRDPARDILTLALAAGPLEG